MLDARSYTSQHEAHTQTRKPERQRHQQKPHRGYECGKHQRRSRAETFDHPVARYLQAAHRSVVEGPDGREAGV
jgi:hypothetical protein